VRSVLFCSVDYGFVGVFLRFPSQLNLLAREKMGSVLVSHRLYEVLFRILL
jgi:hypothetical protein